MCCRVTLSPTPSADDMDDYMQIAGFAKYGTDRYPFWERVIAEEWTQIAVHLLGDKVVIDLHPVVREYREHADKRLAASLMMQTAALIAERTGATIWQEANVMGCVTPEHPSTAVVAVYPEKPLLFENLCLGWKEVLMQGSELRKD